MAELRNVLATAETGGHPERLSGAKRAIAVFRHAVLQGIGAMAACLGGGGDGSAFSGGIGERPPGTRSIRHDR